MTTPLIDKSMPGLLNRMNADIALLFRRIGRPTDPPIPVRGSTAERDAAYPTPTTDAERAALANRRVFFFNTDTGWEESYYAVTGTPGLTVRGLLSGGPAAGWYPTGGRGRPQARLLSSGAKSAVSGTEFDNWYDFTNTAVSADGLQSTRTSSNFDLNGSWLDPGMWGFYDMQANMTTPNGAGTGVLSLGNWRSSVSALVFDIHMAAPLQPAHGLTIAWDYPSVLLRPGDHIYLRSVSGSWAIGGGATTLSLKYAAPPLVPA